MQDIATAALTKQQPDPPRDAARFRRDVVRVLVLGVQVWVIGCAWPLMDAARDPRALEYGLAFAALLALGGGALVPAPSGLAAHRVGRGEGGLAVQRQWVRAGLWLIGFPAALGAACAARPEYWNQQHYATLGLCCLWLTLCVYAATAAAVSSEPGDRLQCTIHARGPDSELATPGRALLHRAWVVLCIAGAVAITLIAPTLGGPAALERDWGDSAAIGGILTAVVAGALGVTTLAVFLGQGLRDQRPVPPSKANRVFKRALIFALLSLLGAFTFVALD